MKHDTVKFESKGNIKMIAHRGLSGLERENTCPAFVAAGQRSYYGIETDVHVTKDGKFILCHDSDIERVTGVNMVIEETNFDTLRAIRFTDICDGFPREDIFLPTLEEYVHICKKYEKHPILEIKGTFSDEQTLRIVEIFKNFNMLEETVFISFSKESCLSLKRVYPDARIQFLSEKPEALADALDFCLKNGFDADFSHKMITKEAVDRIHESGLLFNCWTINTPELAEKMKELGVDFITTNVLE